ncbi:MAG TPA: hypothetical protein VGD78_20285 [Chthoniobacterales bacterium]
MLDPLHHRRLVAASGYGELRMFQEAVAELEAIPPECQGVVPVLAAWVELYQTWQKWEEARSVAERLVELEPDEPNWVVALGYATRRSQGLVAAQQVLTRALERFHEVAVIRYNLACYAAQLGNVNQARALLASAVQRDRAFAQLAKSDPDLDPLRGV